MSIRLRLPVVFTIAAAILFALGSWLFITELSSSLLGSIDPQLPAPLSGASRYLPAPPSPALPPGRPAPRAGGARARRAPPPPRADAARGSAQRGPPPPAGPDHPRRVRARAADGG